MRIFMCLPLLLMALSSEANNINNLNDELYSIKEQLRQKNSVFYEGYSRIHKTFMQTGKSVSLLNHLVYMKHISDMAKAKRTRKRFAVPDLSEAIYQLKMIPMTTRAKNNPQLVKVTMVPRKRDSVNMINEKVSTIVAATRPLNKKVSRDQYIDMKKVTKSGDSVSAASNSSQLYSFLVIAILGMIGIALFSFRRRLFSLFNMKFVNQISSQEISSEEANKIEKPAEKFISKYRQLDFLQIPVISIDEKERVRWANKIASSQYGLTIDSYFLSAHEVFFNKKYQSDTCYLDDDEFLVESGSFSIEGSVETFIYFYPVGDGKLTSISRTVTSKTLPEAFDHALSKHNFLFTNAGIPVAVTCNRVSSEKVFDSALDRIVKATYDISKGIKNTRVNFLMDTIKEKSMFQIEIVNLNYESLFSSNNDKKDQQRFMESWKEIELSLAKRNARVFIFDGVDARSLIIQILMSDNVLPREAVV